MWFSIGLDLALPSQVEEPVPVQAPDIAHISTVGFGLPTIRHFGNMWQQLNSGDWSQINIHLFNFHMAGASARDMTQLLQFVPHYLRLGIGFAFLPDLPPVRLHITVPAAPVAKELKLPLVNSRHLSSSSSKWQSLSLVCSRANSKSKCL